MQVKIINKSGYEFKKGSNGASGFDLVSTVDTDIFPNRKASIPTGIYIELPHGYELQVRSRSGISFKNEAILLNGIGTIDSDYRGEIKVPLKNLGYKAFQIKKGDRIAQAVITKLPEIELIEVEELEDTERGNNGFGSTGV